MLICLDKISFDGKDKGVMVCVCVRNAASQKTAWWWGWDRGSEGLTTDRW